MGHYNWLWLRRACQQAVLIDTKLLYFIVVEQLSHASHTVTVHITGIIHSAYVYRYCSRAHQRAHWRAGHKQECCPTVAQRSNTDVQSVELGELPLPPTSTTKAVLPPLVNNSSGSSSSGDSGGSSERTAVSATSSDSAVAAAAAELFPEFEVSECNTYCIVCAHT
jgi:MYND finger